MEQARDGTRNAAPFGKAGAEVKQQHCQRSKESQSGECGQ
jgi:hypothetical protein